MLGLTEVYVALALFLLFLSVETPLTRALRQRLAGVAGRLSPRTLLRIATAILALVLFASLLSGQPWLIGVTGLTDVAFLLDVTLISLVVGAAGVLKAALEHALRVRPWRLLTRVVRSFGTRRRRAARIAPRPASVSDEDEPADLFAPGLQFAFA